jgi:Lon protease-like protein
MDDTLAKDLVAMWQSELTAMAADREVRESWAALAALWAQSANAAARFLSHEPAPRSAGAAQPAGAAPVAAASEPRLGEVEQLSRRIAELEQRLAEFMARDAGPGKAEGGI